MQVSARLARSARSCSRLEALTHSPVLWGRRRSGRTGSARPGRRASIAASWRAVLELREPDGHHQVRGLERVQVLRHALAG
jgi:hypothetical protein